jgi:hypothetical protein
MPRRIFFQEWFPFRVTEFPVERAFTIGWWCYITPVSSIACPNIELCQLFHWRKNVNKPNLVFLHILECAIRNTFLTNINLGRLSDIASHCKKYIYFIEITFLSQFGLFNTWFHVYPTTARMKNFAGLVKRHLAGIFCGYRPLTAWF